MDAFIQILKFASTLESLSFQALFNHIDRNNIAFFKGERITENNGILINFFKDNFQDQFGDRPDNYKVGIYYLKSSAMAYLLSNEALEQAREDSKAARKEAVDAVRIAERAVYIAIGSLIVTGLVALLPIVLK